MGSVAQTEGDHRRSNKHWFVLVLCAGLPEDFNSKDYKPSPGSLCFIEKLCELHDGLVLEAKGAKEHFWKPFIKKLFERKVLEIHQAYDVYYRQNVFERRLFGSPRLHLIKMINIIEKQKYIKAV